VEMIVSKKREKREKKKKGRRKAQALYK